MELLSRILSLCLFLISFSANCADTALSRELQKNPTYKNLQNQILSDTAISEAGDFIQNALQQQKDLDSNPNGRAKLFYQYKTDDRPCFHCPGYLNLVSEVNSIVDKLKASDSVVVENEKIIQLSRLKFLYFTAKTNLQNGQVLCQNVSHLDPWAENDLKNGSIKLVAEEALSLPNVTDVQFHIGKEVHYFYQGEGEESENIIEVVINKDQTVFLRYYKYDSKLKLPSFDEGSVPLAAQEESAIKIDPKLETEKVLLPTDIKVGTVKNQIALSDSTTMKHESEISFNQQKTNIRLEDSQGKQYLLLEGVNNSGGSKAGMVLINYNFNLDKVSGFGIDSEIKSNVETSDERSSGVKNNQTVHLKLTDHDNEYVSVKAFLDDAGVDNYSVSNSLKAGDGKIGSEYTVNRNGDESLEAGVKNQGRMDLFTLKYSRSSSGIYKYSANAGFSIDPKSKLKTSFTSAQDEGDSVLVSFEQSISETTTMVLTLSRYGQDRKTNLVYQIDGKF